MAVWRYKAVPIDGGAMRSGELAGDSAADVRAALRRARLQVVRISAIKTRSRTQWLEPIERHLRARRRERKADVFDSLATMLDSGLPLLESLDALVDSSRGRLRTMLVQVRESVRAGSSLSSALEAHAAWFDEVEVALVGAGQHGGDLGGVLRSLADRHARSGALTQRLIGALAYPALVACVGMGVVVFLSTRTLPDLVAILAGADVATPRLTAAVMWTGRSIADYGVALVGALLATAVPAWIALRSKGNRWRWTKRLTPVVARRITGARLCAALAELLRAGVPLVEAIRVLAPTIGGLGASSLRASLALAADRIERGDGFAEALDDSLWFDAEFTRLVSIGESAGELDTLLGRLAERYERRSRVLIDRLAALLEPAVILVLAVLVGLVVMAAVLPLLKLQEVI